MSELLRLSSPAFTEPPPPKKVWTRAEIEIEIQRSQAWVERGLLAIYKMQTEDEKRSDATLQNNGVGFSAFDAQTGSYLGKWLISGRHLSGKWLEKGRKLALKYAGQLTLIANR